MATPLSDAPVRGQIPGKATSGARRFRGHTGESGTRISSQAVQSPTLRLRDADPAPHVREAYAAAREAGGARRFHEVGVTRFEGQAPSPGGPA